MVVKQISPNELIVENKPFLEQIIPIAIAGAGIMLIIGSIREYGIQSYYRFTYIMGAIMLFWGSVYVLIAPKASVIHMTIRNGQMRVKHRQGIRMIVDRLISIPAITKVRIEQEEKGKKRRGRPAFRLSVELKDQWVPISHWSKRPVEDHQQAAKNILAFVNKAKKQLREEEE
ncbi:MAG: hypothetical protein AAFY71_06165 [Bacteroidota bacterium]